MHTPSDLYVPTLLHDLLGSSDKRFTQELLFLVQLRVFLFDFLEAALQPLLELLNVTLVVYTQSLIWRFLESEFS